MKWHADTVYSAVPSWGSVKRKLRTHLESYKWHVVCLCAGERSWNLANTFINSCCKKTKNKTASGKCHEKEKENNLMKSLSTSCCNWYCFESGNTHTVPWNWIFFLRFRKKTEMFKGQWAICPVNNPCRFQWMFELASSCFYVNRPFDFFAIITPKKSIN